MFRIGITEMVFMMVLCTILFLLPVVVALVAGRRSAGRQRRTPCPYCGELIQPEAKVCRFCGRDLLSQIIIDQ